MAGQPRAANAYSFIASVAIDTLKMLLKIVIPVMIIWLIPKALPYVGTAIELVQKGF
ncbi:hypothetical protein [Stomatohabitans albus]|uniref:hypothetical protein n=1 Tax=Stomatohabitans albus TaxID=3110766 RepID=UPI00300C981F